MIIAGAPRRACHAGVTLIEILIVVIIIAILAAVGYPSYADYLARSKRTEGRAALIQYATEQEKFYINNNTYATNMSQLRGAGGATYTTDTGRYVISVTRADAVEFELLAEYQEGGREADRCLTYTINSASERRSGPDTDCWER